MDDQQVRHQKHMFYKALSMRGSIQREFDLMQKSGNPVTREEFDAMKLRQPELYGGLFWVEPSND